MSERLRRKDLKGPDEFFSTTQRAVEYARDNPARVALAAAAIVLVALLAVGVRVAREWQDDAAREAWSTAQRMLAQGELEKAAKAFETVHQEHKGSPQAEIALLQVGNLWAELGKNDEARTAFGRLAQTTSDSRLRQMALYNLGMLERAAGDAAAAEEHLQAAARDTGPLRGAAWLAVGAADGNAVDAEVPAGIGASAREWLEARRGE